MADSKPQPEAFHLFDSEADMQGKPPKKKSFHLFDTEVELPTAIQAHAIDPAQGKGESSDPDVVDLYANEPMDTGGDDLDHVKEPSEVPVEANSEIARVGSGEDGADADDEGEDGAADTEDHSAVPDDSAAEPMLIEPWDDPEDETVPEIEAESLVIEPWDEEQGFDDSEVTFPGPKLGERIGDIELKASSGISSDEAGISTVPHAAVEPLQAEQVETPGEDDRDAPQEETNGEVPTAASQGEDEAAAQTVPDEHQQLVEMQTEPALPAEDEGVRRELPSESQPQQAAESLPEAEEAATGDDNPSSVVPEADGKNAVEVVAEDLEARDVALPAAGLPAAPDPGFLTPDEGESEAISISNSPSYAEPSTPRPSVQKSAPAEAAAGVPTFPILSRKPTPLDAQSLAPPPVDVSAQGNTAVADDFGSAAQGGSPRSEEPPGQSRVREGEVGGGKEVEAEGRAEGGRDVGVAQAEGRASAVQGQPLGRATPKFPIFASTEARLGPDRPPGEEKRKAGAGGGEGGGSRTTSTPRQREEEEQGPRRSSEEGGEAVSGGQVQTFPILESTRRREIELAVGGGAREEGEDAGRAHPALELSMRREQGGGSGERSMASIVKVEGSGEEEVELELWEVVKLSVSFVPFMVLFLLVFTEVGYGATVFKSLTNVVEWANEVAIVGALVLLLLYVFDFSFWNTEVHAGLMPLKLFTVSFVLASLIISVVLTFRTRPYAPILCYLCGMCACFFIVFRTAYPNHNLKAFLENLGFTVMLWGFAGFCASLVWAGMSGFWWGPDSRAEFRARLRVCEDMSVSDDGSTFCERYGLANTGVRCRAGCEEVASKSACDVESEQCLAAFLLWGSPFILSLMKLLIGGSLHVIASADTHGGRKPDLQNARIYIICLMVFGLCIWLAAAIASASPELAEMVSAIAVTAMALMFALLGCVVGFRHAGEAVLSTKLYGRIMSLRRSDWLRGALVLTVTPFFGGFLLVSFVNQRIRRWLHREATGHTLTGYVMTIDEHDLTFTGKGHQLLNELCKWDWTSVLKKAILSGFIFFVMQVGVTRWVTLFMAWLNIQLQGASIFAVSAYIFLIAQGLFAIPVVPGVPAYIASGVIVGSAGLAEGWSFGGTMVWGIFVAQMCKQAACLIQQKIFGELLGQQAWVRSALGVNSRVTKAIKLILLEKGITMYKVFLLVGGPDWPTSVLTGVLKIPVLPCQLGTLPVLGPIALTVLAGGAMLKTDEGEWWVNFSALLFTLSGVGLGGSFIFAFIALERTMEDRGGEIDQLLRPAAEGGEFDEEIAVYEREQAELAQLRSAVSAWPVLGSLWQSLIVLSLVGMMASTAIFALAPDACFEPVTVITPYFDPPISGNAFNLIKWPLGWVGLGLQGGSMVLFMAFRQMQAVRAKNAPADLRAVSQT